MKNSDVIWMTAAKARPGKEEQVRQALRDVARAARTQPGCVEYQVVRSAEDPAVTVNVERWESNEHRDAFLDGPEVETFASAIAGAFAESPQPLSYAVLDEA